MNTLKQNLYITYSNQKSRDIKQTITKPLDKVITLESLIIELFEKNNFEIQVDNILGASIIYKIIKDKNIKYFSYLNEDAISLNIIFDFIVKCRRNKVEYKKLLSGDKLDAIIKIEEAYRTYKQHNNLVDIADIEKKVLENWDSWFENKYDEIYVDDFCIGDISFIKSKLQDRILSKLLIYKKLPLQNQINNNTKIIKPKNEVFDNIDEVKTAIKISRKLLEDDDSLSVNDILIVASDIQEYASLYKLFLDEYEMKGYSSIGTPLTLLTNSNDTKVIIAKQQYDLKIKSLKNLYQKLGLTLSKTTKESIKSNIKILDEKIGIELTEPNQIIGLSKRYKNIIFIGTDINHFPPKISDNFLYSYEDDMKYFYLNDYFKSSQMQLKELKRLSDNLYIITASYNGKRELSPSILINKEFDEFIDISDIKSKNDLALDNQAIKEDMSYLDDVKVNGIKATHLSASQINKYLSCPLAYLYSNKIRIQAPKQNEEGFDVMEQGSLMHLCYELFGKFIKEKNITSIDKDELNSIMYDISIQAYQEFIKEIETTNIHHKIFLSSLQAGLKDDRPKGLLAKFVEYYIQNAEEFEYFKNTEFEKEFALDSELKPYKIKDKDDKNYFIKGFIDRFDNLENHINIVDYKSKKAERIDKKKQEEVDTQKDIQLALYILYTKQQYPDKTYDAHLLSFKGNEKGVKFASLSNEDVYDKQYEESLKKLIFDTKTSIEDGEFGYDNSDEKMCEWCDIKYICHESVLSEKIKIT